jgi:hypothetical protein
MPGAPSGGKSGAKVEKKAPRPSDADYHFSDVKPRVDLHKIKAAIDRVLGDRAVQYWRMLENFLRASLSKVELEYIVFELLGPEHLYLHNHLVHSILYNAHNAVLPAKGRRYANKKGQHTLARDMDLAEGKKQSRHRQMAHYVDYHDFRDQLEFLDVSADDPEVLRYGHLADTLHKNSFMPYQRDLPTRSAVGQRVDTLTKGQGLKAAAPETIDVIQDASHEHIKSIVRVMMQGYDQAEDTGPDAPLSSSFNSSFNSSAAASLPTTATTTATPPSSFTQPYDLNASLSRPPSTSSYVARNVALGDFEEPSFPSVAPPSPEDDSLLQSTLRTNGECNPAAAVSARRHSGPRKYRSPAAFSSLQNEDVADWLAAKMHDSDQPSYGISDLIFSLGVNKGAICNQKRMAILEKLLSRYS